MSVILTAVQIDKKAGEIIILIEIGECSHG